MTGQILVTTPLNNNGHYSKENCRWATYDQQNRNQRSNITYKGECAKDASRRLGGGENLVQKRILNGWSVKEAFTTKPHKDFLTEVSRKLGGHSSTVAWRIKNGWSKEDAFNTPIKKRNFLIK